MSAEENHGSSLSAGTLPELQDENSGASPHDGGDLDMTHENSGTASPHATTSELHEQHGAPPENTADASSVDETPGAESAGESVPEVQIELPNISPESPESAEIDTMLSDMEALVAIPQGKVVRGKVMKVTETEVRMNVGTNLEGTVAISEFLNLDGQVTVAPGDEVGVWVEHYNEKQGTVTVSRLKAARLEIWDRIETAFRDQQAIPGRVIGRIQGGLTVDVGVHAFMPSSQADVRPLRNLDSLVGQDITCKVIKLIRKRSNIVVSRKLVLEEEANHLKAALLERLREGMELTGRVKNLTEFGAFLDLGGMDGLLHVTDMSWARVTRPSEVVQVGQELNVKVLKFDAEKGRISLSLKELLPDPWERVPSSFHASDRVTGRVANVTDFGAFIELEPGIEGLVHVSELGWSKRPRHPSKIVKVGDRVEVAVLDVNLAQRRISLSLKQTMPDPWDTVLEKYPAGSHVEATVTNLTDFGAFAEVDSDIEGLIHNVDLTWAKKVKHPSEVLKKGEKIKAMVLSLDAAHRRLSLGLKQLQPDPWDGFLARARVGDVLQAKVSHMAPFGAFVEIEKGIEGLCHTSEIGDKHSAAGKGQLDVGSEFEFRVIRLDPIERKISLSLKPVVAPPPPPARKEKRADGSFGNAGPAGGTQAAKKSGSFPETKKKAEPLTTMAEALSAAGITSAPRATPEPARAKVGHKPTVIVEEPQSRASSSVTAEHESAPTHEHEQQVDPEAAQQVSAPAQQIEVPAPPADAAAGADVATQGSQSAPELAVEPIAELRGDEAAAKSEPESTAVTPEAAPSRAAVKAEPEPSPLPEEREPDEAAAKPEPESSAAAHQDAPSGAGVKPESEAFALVEAREPDEAAAKSEPESPMSAPESAPGVPAAKAKSKSSARPQEAARAGATVKAKAESSAVAKEQKPSAKVRKKAAAKKVSKH